MDRALTIDEIKQNIRPIAEEYGVRKIDLFGSYANGAPRPESDIDLLVDFGDDPVCLLTVIGFEQDIEDATNKKVETITLPLSDSFINIPKVVPIYG